MSNDGDETGAFHYALPAQPAARLLNRRILSKSSEIEAITKRCRGIKMFCLGERDTLLVTYIRGSFFFPFFFLRTHYYAEKRHWWWGAIPEGRGTLIGLKNCLLWAAWQGDLAVSLSHAFLSYPLSLCFPDCLCQPGLGRTPPQCECDNCALPVQGAGAGWELSPRSFHLCPSSPGRASGTDGPCGKGCGGVFLWKSSQEQPPTLGVP